MAHGPRLPSGIAAVGIEAAAAYRVFAATDVHAVERGLDQQAQVVSWASQQFGRLVVPPDLSKAGFHFAGGRRLAKAYGPACMFFYENPAGGRIMAFMRPMIRHDMNAPMQPMQAERTAGYVWAHDGLGVGLVTANPMSSLRQMSNMVRDAM
jgi:anti-sigma factor RsiW